MTKNINESYKLKSKVNVILTNIFLASFGLYFGFHHTIFNSLSKPYIQYNFNITDGNTQNQVISNINFYYTIGLFLGGIVSSITMKFLGVRKSTLLFLILSFLIPFLFLTNILIIVYITRFFIGILASIMLSITGSIINEYIPIYYRKIGSTIFNVYITLGFLLGLSMGFIFQENIGRLWYIAVYVLSIIDFLKVLFFIYFIKFESPVYSFNVNKLEEVKNYFNFYHKEDFQWEEYNKFILIMENYTKESKFQLKDFFNKKYSKFVFFGLFINFIRQMIGINIVLYYSTIIFSETTNNPTLLTLVVGISNIVSASIPIFFKFLSQRKFLLLGMFNITISLILIIIASSFKINILLNFGLIYFGFSYSYSFGSSFFGYISSIWNSFISQVSISFQWISAIFLSKYSLDLIELIGINYVFLIFLIFNLLATVIFLGYSIEIENKTRDQIYYEFLNKSFFNFKTKNKIENNINI